MKNVPFATITETARLTGVSTYMLRRRCRERSIPCLPIGDDPTRPTKLRAEAAQGLNDFPPQEREKEVGV